MRKLSNLSNDSATKVSVMLDEMKNSIASITDKISGVIENPPRLWLI